MSAAALRKPLVGVLCCNEDAGRAAQVVSNRFVAPLATIADATVLLVPAMPEACDAATMAQLLDGLLLTGSRSNVAPARYGGAPDAHEHDEGRDTVALHLAARMIEACKPVFGICRGMQEINVLFGGTLTDAPGNSGHHGGSWDDGYDRLLGHRHEVELVADGVLSRITGEGRLVVNSVHRQGVGRLGAGLRVEAVATHDRLVEAIWANPCGGDVLGVQWHPEWDAAQSAASRAFFERIGRSLRDGREPRWEIMPPPSSRPWHQGSTGGRP